jgi:formylglycine-generating enzyme required for sulfatase activity
MKISKSFPLFVGIILTLIFTFILNSQGKFVPKVDAKDTAENDIFLPIVTKPYSPPELSDMMYIPAGEFQMGCDATNPNNEECRSDEIPLHTVYLDSYYIGKYETTNEEFVKFLNWKGNNNCSGHECVDIYGYRIHLIDGKFVLDSGFEKYPVYEVTWYAADEYCEASGGRLPTEAEWEKAARGSSDTRMFPWGNQMPNCTYANFKECFYDPTIVGSFPAGASPYGVLDMSGNVSEWVNDIYNNRYYYDSPYMNPTGPEPEMGYESFRVYRGGRVGYDWQGIQVANRMNGLPDNNYSETGFRCVSSAGN